LLKIDHVLLACRNLYVTADEFRDQTGLNFYEGGYFKGFGIAQKLVPLGNQQYLEIESVVDPQEAEECQWDIARSMMSMTRRVPRLFSMYILTDHFEEQVARNGSEPFHVVRTKPDGSLLEGYIAPATEIAYKDELPIFQSRGGMSDHPADTPVDHRVEPNGIAWMELGGPEERIRSWIGDEFNTLPLRFAGDEPGIRALAIKLKHGGEFVLRPSETGLISPH
jgi:hypothetical protein